MRYRRARSQPPGSGGRARRSETRGWPLDQQDARARMARSITQRRGRAWPKCRKGACCGRRAIEPRPRPGCRLPLDETDVLGRAAPALVDQADQGGPFVAELIPTARGPIPIGNRQVETEPGEVDVGRPAREHVPPGIGVPGRVRIVGMRVIRGMMGTMLGFVGVVLVVPRHGVRMPDPWRRDAARQHEGRQEHANRHLHHGVQGRPPELQINEHTNSIRILQIIVTASQHAVNEGRLSSRTAVGHSLCPVLTRLGFADHEPIRHVPLGDQRAEIVSIGYSSTGDATTTRSSANIETPSSGTAGARSA